MNLSAQNTNYPKWLDRAEYPFENNYFELSIGKIHYIVEGKGEPIVMVHGNPAKNGPLYSTPLPYLCLRKNHDEQTLIDQRP